MSPLADAVQRVRCCSSAGCLASGAGPLRQALETAVARRELQERLVITGVGCLGPCSQGPLVAVDPEGILFGGVSAGDADGLIAALAHRSQAALASEREAPLSWTPAAGERLDTSGPFFSRQRRVVLEHCGLIDPERIEAAMECGAYGQLRRVVQTLTPTEVVETIRRSGLRGRGGAGYPTGLKWATVAKMPQGQKVVVCNADEGDPGAFTDRSVLEGDPHRVLEGMVIAAYAVGADHGFIYIRAEYELAIVNLRRAIEQASRQQLLGQQLFGSSFSFTVQLRVGAGAYVCGEETALIHSIEGGRGTPRPRPPYPAEAGVGGAPTLINNVETFANVVPILREGADWFAAIGTAGSKGTKVFSLTGNVRRGGLVEVPMGTSLATIVAEMGEGTPDGSGIKAVQTGGPSGGCVPAAHLDTPVDYESLQALGTIMGSGGMVVIDHATDMVALAAFFMAFCREESCGKCVPCRAGTVQLHALLQKHLAGEASAADLAQLEALCHMVKDTSLCGLGQSAPKPVLSTLRFFRGEYEARLRPGTAPSPLTTAGAAP
ncbi:SLBB domain-containing protein [Synechococcus sp. CS-1325]|uniref:(2Fe-2S) ferredoxin domain-containing protein n=1 Tax=Synechococcus sp. CS-1325 TaxID=2847979 RepID=UPI00223AE177|nr:NADH-ubiquinone oxidoreductase-F iron-sulfur binding region domain-containing protein [Synechococcus sp. CS-1325]MCT0198339.1 SLBB domain-containing protein [Synechococcus sp. CS-1325]